MAKRYGKWATVKSLGEGGQGHIYLVREIGSTEEKYSVVKRLKNPARLDLFEREVNAIRALEHPNILRIVHFELMASQPYFVAEYCERGSLADVGAPVFRGDVAETVRVLLPIVEALSAAHAAGIVHRDIKPQNILMRRDGQPVLADFGICHKVDDNKFTLTDEAVGSTNYIAPEMESGHRFGEPSPETDAYSLGKVMYWMLSGGNVFAREDHRNRPLPGILGEQRFEHVHMFLDRIVREDPAERARFSELPDLLKRMEKLVMGDFAPLKPSIGIQCRFCGQGTYIPHDTHSEIPEAIGLHSVRTGVYTVQAAEMHCGHCGHIELFSTDKTRPWWRK